PKSQLLDDGEADVLRFQDLDLAVNHPGIDRRITDDGGLLKYLDLARVDQQRCPTGETWRRRQQIRKAETKCERRRNGDDWELAPSKVEKRREKFRRGGALGCNVAFVDRRCLGSLEHVMTVVPFSKDKIFGDPPRTDRVLHASSGNSEMAQALPQPSAIATAQKHQIIPLSDHDRPEPRPRTAKITAGSRFSAVGCVTIRAAPFGG